MFIYVIDFVLVQLHLSSIVILSLFYWKILYDTIRLFVFLAFHYKCTVYVNNKICIRSGQHMYACFAAGHHSIIPYTRVGCWAPKREMFIEKKRIRTGRQFPAACHKKSIVYVNHRTYPQTSDESVTHHS